jgi:hypothetical protein
MGTRVYEFRQGRPHFEAMIFACATGLAILLAAGATLRTSDAAVPAGRPEPTTHASAAPTPTVRRPSADEIDSAWVSQSSAPTISVGGDATLTLRFRNTGTVAWIRGAVSEVSLAYVGDYRRFDPRMSVDWPLPGRPATQSENAVAPVRWPRSPSRSVERRLGRTVSTCGRRWATSAGFAPRAYTSTSRCASNDDLQADNDPGQRSPQCEP